MSNEPEYKQLYSSESHGQYGMIGIRVLVTSSAVPDLFSHDVVRDAGYKVGDILKEAIGTAVIASDLDAQKHAGDERLQLLSLFVEQPIYAEPIPNGYCSLWCCKHLPWYVVTTRIGRITVGWRKRVISIDWSGSMAKKTANELFPAEDVTKDGCLIHAWSVEDGQRYIKTVIESVA